MNLYLEGGLEAPLGMAIGGQVVGDGHLSDGIIQRSRFDDRIVAISVGHQNHSLVLILCSSATLPLLHLLRLPLSLRLLLFPPPPQLHLRHLRHGYRHPVRLLVHLFHRLLQLLLLLLRQPTRLRPARGCIGPLFGLFLLLLCGS
ncbi:hypothetical protein V8G54_006348 [Vigna mungo]|uniref:Uncharacterized protein n=1 Tax=Vigna mungo TaxID=3915 RepID=A0AAQ3P1D7_VIGMU